MEEPNENLKRILGKLNKNRKINNDEQEFMKKITTEIWDSYPETFDGIEEFLSGRINDSEEFDKLMIIRNYVFIITYGENSFMPIGYATVQKVRNSSDGQIESIDMKILDRRTPEKEYVISIPYSQFKKITKSANVNRRLLGIEEDSEILKRSSETHEVLRNGDDETMINDLAEVDTIPFSEMEFTTNGEDELLSSNYSICPIKLMGRERILERERITTPNNYSRINKFVEDEPLIKQDEREPEL